MPRPTPTSDRHEYYWKMDAQRQEAFRKGVEGIAIGISLSQATEVLGKPDFDRQVYGKEPPRPFIARTLIYYVARWDPVVVSETKDERVIMTFDEQDRLTRLDSTVQGISSKP